MLPGEEPTEIELLHIVDDHDLEQVLEIEVDAALGIEAAGEDDTQPVPRQVFDGDEVVHQRVDPVTA